MAQNTRSHLAVMLGFIAILALGACSTPLGGKSKYADDPNYGAGYADGCATGNGFNPHDPSTLYRDATGWAQNAAYRSGWKKGFNACRATQGGLTSDYPADARGRNNGPSGY